MSSIPAHNLVKLTAPVETADETTAVQTSTAPLERLAQNHEAGGSSHIPALDGVRGLAVLLVLWCHCGAVIESHQVAGIIDRLAFTSARMATSGVDLFFVLSGFLITGILYDAKGGDRYFRNFYARRTVRIFPLYYACLFLFFIVTPLLSPAASQRMGSPPTSSVWYWLYLSNYSQSIMVYLGQNTEHPLFLTWSLAVEEQFYLIWPAIVFFLTRKQLLRACGAMIVLSLSLRAALWCILGKDSWQILLDFTPCRLDVLATGAAIALIARTPGGVQQLFKPAKVVFPIAIVLLVGMIGLMAKLGYRSGLIATPGYAIFGSTLTSAMYGALLVFALTVSPRNLIAKFFNSLTLRTFGKYSYAVYLFHLPVTYVIGDMLFTPAEHRIAGTWMPALVVFTILVSIVTLGFALMSWNLFEKHFLKLKRYFPSR